MQYADKSPKEIRALIRNEKITHNTSGMCGGFAQANLIILPKDDAYDFLVFAGRNPKSCPVLEVSEVGSRDLRYIADGADIATDIPKYRVYEKGIMTGEYTNAEKFWRKDLVSFLIGCSFSFETALLEAAVPVRHIEEGRNVPMYLTNVDCVPAGKFSGKMVVSMRPIPYNLVVKAVEITAGMPRVHGAPIHIGAPEVIGIKDINKPDFGDSVTINPGEVP
ncbi:MAG: putative hydro-lyase, partial [Christensenellaceae bacterium]|nr:putative hydro-lyase [Christensenellaceae bacterium]